MKIRIDLTFDCPMRGQLQFRVDRAINEGPSLFVLLFLITQTANWLAYRLVNFLQIRTDAGEIADKFPTKTFAFEYKSQPQNAEREHRAHGAERTDRRNGDVNGDEKGTGAI